MKLPLTTIGLVTIGLVIFVIGLDLDIMRLEARIDKLEYRGAVVTGAARSLGRNAELTALMLDL